MSRYNWITQCDEETGLECFITGISFALCMVAIFFLVFLLGA